MEKKYSEIKKNVNHCYEMIKHFEEALKELREICDHPETEIVDYMWRIGSITKANVCKICGEVIDTPFSIDPSSNFFNNQYISMDIKET